MTPLRTTPDCSLVVVQADAVSLYSERGYRLVGTVQTDYMQSYSEQEIVPPMSGSTFGSYTQYVQKCRQIKIPLFIMELPPESSLNKLQNEITKLQMALDASETENKRLLKVQAEPMKEAQAIRTALKLQDAIRETEAPVQKGK